MLPAQPNFVAVLYFFHCDDTENLPSEDDVYKPKFPDNCIASGHFVVAQRDVHRSSHLPGIKNRTGRITVWMRDVRDA